jgi:predicted nucleic acid-binding protein
MKPVYLDSSVILRILFGEPKPLANWSAIADAYTSRVTQVEVLRVLDRRRLTGDIDDEGVARTFEQFHALLQAINVMPIAERVLVRAEGAMMTVVATLDAIHVATAFEVSMHLRKQLVVATHDMQQGRAARALGLEVIGC